MEKFRGWQEETKNRRTKNTKLVFFKSLKKRYIRIFSIQEKHNRYGKSRRPNLYLRTHFWNLACNFLRKSEFDLQWNRFDIYPLLLYYLPF